MSDAHNTRFTEEIPMGDYIYQGFKFPNGTTEVIRWLSDKSPLKSNGKAETVRPEETPQNILQEVRYL